MIVWRWFNFLRMSIYKTRKSAESSQERKRLSIHERGVLLFLKEIS